MFFVKFMIKLMFRLCAVDKNMTWQEKAKNALVTIIRMRRRDKTGTASTSSSK